MPTDANDLKLLLKATAFAAHKHRAQRRKDAEASPYINHPIALANILCNEAGIADIEVICGALLHDTVEDTETTLDELEAEFSSAIRRIVSEVTDDKSLEKQERKRRQIEKAASISNDAKLVKLADKIANLRDITNTPPAKWSLERRQEYFDWAKQVVDQMRGAHHVLERLFDEAYMNKPT